MSAVTRCVRCSVEVPAITADGTCPQCSAETIPTPPRPADHTLTRPPDTRDPSETVARAPDRPAEVPTFGNYELLGELGRGGMGVVYRARQARVDRVVALKVIRGGSADGPARQRFLAEARALARISHPHIVTVFEVGEEADCPFFTMEFVDGGSLHERVKRGPAFGAAEAARLVEDLAGAVQSAHAVGVLHRDIKPANVLLTAAGTPRLTDFGLAKHLSEDAGVTVAGSALGTPSYMSPEQAEGKADGIGPATDVYSLGATLYELLTGRPPFRGESARATVLQVLNQEVVPPGKLRKGLSRELEAICLKCLEKNPAKRYVSAGGLADDLTRWRTGLSTVARPLGWPRRAWRFVRRRPLWAAGAAAVLLAAGGVWYATRTPPPPPTPEVTAQEELKAGRPFTLIGPTGPPVQQRWLTGTPPPGTPDATKPFVVQTDQSCDIELLADPGVDRYRFTLEMRQTEVSKYPSIGFYFGRHEFGPPDDPATAAISVSYHDLWRDKSHRPDNVYFASADMTSKTSQNAYDLGRFKKGDGANTGSTAAWRRLGVEVTPERIDLLFPNADGELVSKRALDADGKLIKQANFFLNRALDRNYPPGSVVGDHYRVRGGVGISVSHATAEFRNAVIEPLPPPPK